ncbi:FeoA family protein [Sutterella megalosphaeroides]|uniref:Iron transporter FeoA n=1 Tax=Sutterella megalosphaeroides TaxID=2494234 RepID=A0A2Z6I9D5_9BURK|nr:FeoA family protein [Sutterella megalosphaeroides]BBF23055.1 iron transporter FeoA [Sutterella megalosphaeroides]
MLLLKELPIGARGRIVGFHNEHREYRRRLLMLGATPGTTFEVVRRAPLGDPIEIRVRGSFISVRKDEAELMHIERLSD